MSLLQLKLARVPNVLGIYGKSGNEFPARMAFLQPEAAKAYVHAAAALKLRTSDMYRTAAESLAARASKRGVQPPGFSAHNYGLAIDIDTDAVLKATGLTKPALDKQMEEYGWYCHRKDGKRGMEDWHYNYFGNRDEALPWVKACAASSNRSGGIEAKIKTLFGAGLQLTNEEAQAALSKLKLYSGAIDGIFGAGSRQALTMFQKTWGLGQTGAMDAKTERTLAYVSAEIGEVPLS